MPAEGYGGPEQAGGGGGGSGGASSSVLAGWDITKTRYWLIDYDGGNDSNVGYVDATAGSTIAPAGLALKTMERFYQLCPTLGNGRASVTLQKPRAGGANYLKMDGVTLDSIDNSRFKGYQIFQWRASTDLTNSLSDRIACGFQTVVAGPNGDGSFTVAAGGTTTTVPIAAGSLGADPACTQFRIRFDLATATVALRNVARVIVSHTTTTLTIDGSAMAAPAAGDTFFIERTGVRVDQIVHDSRAMSPNGTNVLFRQHTIVGIGATTVTSRRMTVSGPDVHLTGCEQVTPTNNPVFNWYAIEVGTVADSYIDDAGVNIQIGLGLRLNCAYNFQYSGQISSIAAFGAMKVGAPGNFFKLTAGNFGARSYFATGPTFQSCGMGTAGNGFVFAPFLLGFSFGATSLSASQTRINAGGIAFDGCNGSILKVDFAAPGAVPCIKINANLGAAFCIEGCTGGAGTDVGIDITNSVECDISLGRGTANTLTGAAGDIRLAGGAITTHAGFATTNVVDRAGNNVIGSGDRTVDQCSLFTNVDGSALAIGEVVRVSAANNVVRAKADTAATATGPLFAAVTPPANNAAGYFVAMDAPQKWVLHDAAPTLLGLSYVSPGTGGAASTTIPAPAGPPTQKRRLGHVAKVSGNFGLLTGSPELLSVDANGAL